jgi:hypothetical protein
MRTKKPCVRARRVLEGWYVRFMGKYLGKKLSKIFAGVVRRNLALSQNPGEKTSAIKHLVAI